MDAFGTILWWLAVVAALIYIGYNWLLVAKSRRLKPAYAASIVAGTGLLILAVPSRLYPNLPPDAANTLSWLGVATVVTAILIDFPLKRKRIDPPNSPD